MIKQLAVLFFFIGLSQANAGVLFEPYIGYGFGSSEQGSSKSNANGPEYGARIAFETLGFFVGAEYMAATMKTKNKTTNTAYNYNITNIGATAGFQFPILIRAYASYFFTSNAKVDTTIPATYSGNAMKLGVGFTGLPIVSINLEYIATTYTKAEAMGITQTISPKATGSMYAISISAPLTF